MDNEVAKQLWLQLFAKLAKADDATIFEAGHEVEAEARMRTGLTEAGWSSAEIEERIQLHRLECANAPVTSPGVAPHVEHIFERLSDDIEAAMDRLNLHSHARVARGIEPRIGPIAAMTNVIMTDQGIVTVGSFLFRFCGLIARAFTRTLRLNPWLWEDKGYSQEAAHNLFRASPQLVTYWFRIHLSYALTGTHVVAPYWPANKYEVLHFEQVARAMEIFAIAHEYGHHHHSHGRQLSADPKQEEFDADQFALKISYDVERQPVIASNPFLSSGAGGVILLLALETLRKVTEVVSGIRSPQRTTHPTISERLPRFDSVAVLRPTEFSVLKGFRVASERIMTVVDAELTDLLRVLPPKFAQELREFGHS